MTETVHVAVDLNGRTTPASTLHVDTGRTTSSTFTYDPGYLATAGALDWPIRTHRAIVYCFW